jgi:hypothetical protein
MRVVALAKNIPAAQAMGEQGRLRVEADFSGILVVQRTRQIIANIAETSVNDTPSAGTKPHFIGISSNVGKCLQNLT